jgi:hypothetical protein
MTTRQEDRRIVPDGATVRVPLTMMDSLQHVIVSGGTTVVDARGRPAGQRPGACYANHDPQSTDHALAVTADLMRSEARADAIAEMCDAWRPSRPSPTTGYGVVESHGMREGDRCMIAGRRGTRNAQLKCIPDKDWPASGDARDAAYREMITDLEGAWRGPK